MGVIFVGLSVVVGSAALVIEVVGVGVVVSVGDVVGLINTWLGVTVGWTTATVGAGDFVLPSCMPA